ncbi:hypothetical protein B0H16DRAFT_553620 [Mycena metata]|uniref:Uncharacterized protein n=1 Tax=Mycena metata TaxID=1033252 RepID=A0AAD7MDS1_9AGAR|nr:hypothetical protein B0H16DRAFT_553620 [Mycena metata]
MSVESAWNVHRCASLRGFSNYHGNPSDTMARMVHTAMYLKGKTRICFTANVFTDAAFISAQAFLKGTKPAGARANDRDARFDGAAGIPSVEIASLKRCIRSHPRLFTSEPSQEEERNTNLPPADSIVLFAPAHAPIAAVSLERLHYTKMRGRSDQIVFGAQRMKIATAGSRRILGALGYDGKCSACFGSDANRRHSYARRGRVGAIGNPREQIPAFEDRG